MNFKISKLSVDELEAVDELMKRHSRTLGFLSTGVLEDYFFREGVLGAKSSNGQLVGYLLFAINIKNTRVRIAQLCVSDDFQGQGLAKSLVEALVGLTTTQTEITLRCRRDYPAHHMWPKLKFIPIHESPGRAQDGSVLTYWRRPLQPETQMSLFQAQTHDETVDVVIDSPIFIDLSNSDVENNQTYKTLTTDSLIVPTKFWITDELFLEIDRNKDSGERESNRKNAHLYYAPVRYDPKTAEYYEEKLKEVLPSNNDNQISDIRHLAQTTASDISTFVTRDNRLLNKANEIRHLTNLDVLSPTDLIVKLHESFDRDSYTPNQISGLSLMWCRLTNENFPRKSYAPFLLMGEKLHQLRRKLEVFLAEPNRYRCQLLSLNNEIVAIRVDEIQSDSTLVIHFCRVRQQPATEQLFIGYLVTSALYDAIHGRLSLVKFTDNSNFPAPVSELIDKCFVKCGQNYVRFCLTSSLTRDAVLEQIKSLCPEVVETCSDMSDLELEQFCSPLNLLENQQSKFLIPIRRGYAMSLLNCALSTEDLIGGQVGVLLQWTNVYYRTKSHHKMLKSPARILWYVSSGRNEIGEIMAISRLDEIEIGTPKELFRKFKRYGILDWNAIYDICKKDVNKKIMVLRFSHTFPFRNRVDRSIMEEVYNNLTRKHPVIWSPAKLDSEIFNKIFQLGYSDE